VRSMEGLGAGWQCSWHERSKLKPTSAGTRRIALLCIGSSVRDPQYCAQWQMQGCGAVQRFAGPRWSGVWTAPTRTNEGVCPRIRHGMKTRAIDSPIANDGAPLQLRLREAVQ